MGHQTDLLWIMSATPVLLIIPVTLVHKQVRHMHLVHFNFAQVQREGKPLVVKEASQGCPLSSIQHWCSCYRRKDLKPVSIR